MTDVITRWEQVTPAWLTDTLRAKGYLPLGQVTAVEQKDTFNTTTSLVVRFVLDYSTDAPATAPRRMFMKMTKSGEAEDFAARVGPKEVALYNGIAGTATERWVPHCYSAAYAAETDTFHLLLEDLTDSHTQPEWPLPPLQEQCEQAIDCLANIHAFWWDHPQLGKEMGSDPDNSELSTLLGDAQALFASFVDFMGDRLSSERRSIYEQVLASAPGLMQRFLQEKNLTLTHGDAHLWNFLYPHDMKNDTVRLVDWQSSDTSIGAADLAYMMALHWFPERRARLEKPLLRRYHDRLIESGISGYAWDDCWYDYRFSTILNLFIPVWQWSVKLWASIWWPHLERSFLAYEDLGCAELLDM